MRNTLKIAILAALFFGVGCSKYDRELMGDPEPDQPEPAYVEEQAAPADEDSMGVGMFNELRYYGQWFMVEPYGWVWRPTVVSEWQPFVNGHWIWTQYGWMWVDYDQWGWATSHYGYWTTDFSLGWIWIPDYQWSPVQCDWFVYDDYICWSPVAPEGARFKEPWEGDKAWVSVPVRRFKEQEVGGYRVTPKFKPENMTNATRTPPDVREIEGRGAKFPLVQVQLDRRVVGEHEFAKVNYPADQFQTIQNRRQGSNTSTSYSPPPSSGNNGGGYVGSGTTHTTPPPPARKEETGKSKDSNNNSGSSSGEKKESSYKGKRADDKKDDGKSKTENKSGKKGK